MCLHILAAVIVFLLPSTKRRPKSNSGISKKEKQSVPLHNDEKNGGLKGETTVETTVMTKTNGDASELNFTGKDISNDFEKFTNRIKDKLGKEAHNIEELFDKTVAGITELTDDFKKINDSVNRLIPNENLRKRNITSNDPSECELLTKKEAGAFNCSAQNTNVLPTVFGNVNAK